MITHEEVPQVFKSLLGDVCGLRGPTFAEKAVTVGVWATGALIYTLLMKFAIPVYTGELRFYTRGPEQ